MLKLPEVDSPERYAGLYVFDFGGQVALGYTADEIAVLLESERYREGKVYRIHRAWPDGRMELAGVSAAVFQLEDGLFFYRADLEAARRDFEELAGLDEPPCRMKLHLAHLPGAAYEYVTAAIYPAERTHDVSSWLGEHNYAGGDFVEGGPSQVSSYSQAGAVVIERRQRWPVQSGARSVEEILASTHLPVQRKFA